MFVNKVTRHIFLINFFIMAQEKRTGSAQTLVCVHVDINNTLLDVTK